MGFYLNRLDEPVFITVSKPLLTEVGIQYRLERFLYRLETIATKTVAKVSNPEIITANKVGIFGDFLECTLLAPATSV